MYQNQNQCFCVCCIIVLNSLQVYIIRNMYILTQILLYIDVDGPFLKVIQLVSNSATSPIVDVEDGQIFEWCFPGQNGCLS